jgi:hypothetical protein
MTGPERPERLGLPLIAEPTIGVSRMSVIRCIVTQNRTAPQVRKVPLSDTRQLADPLRAEVRFSFNRLVRAREQRECII